MLSDEELMAAVAQGDGSALEALCRRWERSLHRFIWRQTGGRDVDDLHQETWLRVVRAADRFDRSRRFSTWLFRIAINQCRDWHRRRPPDPVPPAVAARDQTAADPGAATAAALDASRLLAALPDAQREVVVLRYYHDLPDAEVATILDVPVGTVKSRFHHAMAKLRRMVAEEDA
jgi:RNA polymerase sigma factor (sigma-70 family)